MRRRRKRRVAVGRPLDLQAGPKTLQTKQLRFQPDIGERGNSLLPRFDLLFAKIVLFRLCRRATFYKTLGGLGPDNLIFYGPWRVKYRVGDGCLMGKHFILHSPSSPFKAFKKREDIAFLKQLSLVLNGKNEHRIIGCDIHSTQRHLNAKQRCVPMWVSHIKSSS